MRGRSRPVVNDSARAPCLAHRRKPRRAAINFTVEIDVHNRVQFLQHPSSMGAEGNIPALLEQHIPGVPKRANASAIAGHRSHRQGSTTGGAWPLPPAPQPRSAPCNQPPPRSRLQGTAPAVGMANAETGAGDDDRLSFIFLPRGRQATTGSRGGHAKSSTFSAKVGLDRRCVTDQIRACSRRRVLMPHRQDASTGAGPPLSGSSRSSIQIRRQRPAPCPIGLPCALWIVRSTVAKMLPPSRAAKGYETALSSSGFSDLYDAGALNAGPPAPMTCRRAENGVCACAPINHLARLMIRRAASRFQAVFSVFQGGAILIRHRFSGSPSTSASFGRAMHVAKMLLIRRNTVALRQTSTGNGPFRSTFHPLAPDHAHTL